MLPSGDEIGTSTALSGAVGVASHRLARVGRTACLSSRVVAGTLLASIFARGGESPPPLMYTFLGLLIVGYISGEHFPDAMGEVLRRMLKAHQILAGRAITNQRGMQKDVKIS